MRLADFALFLVGSFLFAVALQWVARRAGARFRSAERKSGTYRAGGGQGTSSKLPMTGGPAMVVAALLAGWAAARWFFTWPGAWVVALAVAGYGVVGLLDDYGKFRGGKGMSQRVKTVGCLTMSIVVGFLLTRAGGHPWAANTVVRWVIESAFLFCFAVAADFSDGIDGLAGGLGALAALGMLAAAMIAAREGAFAFSIGLVVILAFLLFNRPSAWTSKGAVPRRASVYLGDSGALAMGGGLAAAALWMHLGWVFVPVAGVWLIEGFSSMWQAEFLVKLVYRRFGRVERYGSAHAPHTEFPLPLLAAPIHHHFEVSGWDRLRVVALLYAVAVVCAVSGVLASFFGPMLLAGYIIAGAALVGLWSFAGLYRTFYLAVGDGGKIIVNSGVPFRLRRLRYHCTVQRTSLSATDLTPDERLWFYRPLPRPDALEMLVRLLAAHGRAEEAAAVEASLPQAMREMRLADIPLADRQPGGGAA